MLKLQQVSIRRDIAMRFRSDEPFWCRRFFVALGLALLIHLAGFLLIDIGKLKIPPQQHRITISVDANMGANSSTMKGTMLTLQIDEHGLLPRYVLEPEASIPVLPEMPEGKIQRSLDHNRGLALVAEHFTQVERVPFRSRLPYLPYVQVISPINLQVTGRLAERKVDLSSVDKMMEMAKRFVNDGQKVVKLSIRIDDRTGKVFWSAIQQSSENKHLDEIASEMVSRLKFDEIRHGFVSEGDVEIHFTSYGSASLKDQLGQLSETSPIYEGGGRE